MYVCGPTVYNYIHIGNARVFVFFDVLRRYLEMSGYEVTYVQNFTDVDDRLIEASKASGKSVPAIAEEFIQAYFEDMDALGVKRATLYPRATEHIEGMIKAVQQLLEKGNAYEVDGDVYFRVRQKGYGKLSHQSFEDLKQGARVEVNEKKEHPLDFALWKAAKPGEISWETPWGVPGRPGWHIECSVMANHYLGDTLDIHAGGADLCFPHHENEIAQSEALTGKPFANYWLHNGYIHMGKEKMSKSLGNVKRVVDLRQEYSAPTIRYFLLSVHYRQPLSFTEDNMEQAKASVQRLQTAVDNVRYRLDRMDTSNETAKNRECEEVLSDLRQRITKALNDDLNTANAISVLFDAAKIANEWAEKENVEAQSLQAILDFFSQYGKYLLGLVTIENKDALDREIEQLIEERELARKKRDFARADQIRDQLSAQGIILEDTPQGVRWRRK